jgi:hypothetical protein
MTRNTEGVAPVARLTSVVPKARVVLGGGHPPVGWTVGFLRAPFAAVLRATLDWWRKLHPAVDEIALSGPFPDALLALAPLQSPPTREIIASTAGDEWTANLVNNHLGGDSSSWCGHLSGVLGCDAVEATHIPIDQYAYPTTTLVITSSRAQPPLYVLRSLAAGKYDSGRWRFVETGETQAFEEAERYGAKRIRDRFDREMLLRYLAALRITPDDPKFWVGGALLQHQVSFTPRTTALADVRREYGID